MTLVAMQGAYSLVGGGPGAAAIAVGFIALVGALAGALTSYLVASRGRYVNTITAERSKWIEKLRANIANYSSAIAQIKMRTAGYGYPDAHVQIQRLQEKLEEVNLHASLIQLQLNPWGEIDQNILRIINSIVVRVGGDVALLIRADQLLIAHSQWLLKSEWEKVKFEAGGPIYRLIHEADERSRLANYRKWVAGEGSLEQLLADLKQELTRT